MRRACWLGVLLGGCAPADPMAGVPPGLHVVARAAALGPLLDRLVALEGTQLSVVVKAARPEIGVCPDEVWLSEAPGGWSVRCEVPDTLAPLQALRAGRDLFTGEAGAARSAAFILPDRGIGRLVGAADIGPAGELELLATLPDPPGGTAWDLILPSGEDPGPDRLPNEGALLHARVKQARVADVASLAAKNQHENDIFGMQSQLFAAAMLSGTWEVGLWGVAPGGRVPRIALAVGVRSPDIARAAATEYVASLAQRWSFTPQARTLGGHEASCLAGLNLLPELAPCWTIDGNDMIAAWNADTLTFILENPPSATAHTPHSRARLSLGAFAEADAALTRAFAPRSPAPNIAYPWSYVDVSATRIDDQLRIELRAEAPGAPAPTAPAPTAPAPTEGALP